jgi:hypothetical protein
MLRTTIACLLIAVLAIEAISAAAAQSAVREQIAKFKHGRKIKVELNSGSILKGRLGTLEPDQFTLEANGLTASEAEIRFDEVRSVKPDGLTRAEKWTIFGVIWIGLGIVNSRLL